MSQRAFALAAAAVAIALVLAQDLAPASGLYHTWQYVLVLALALAVTVSYGERARRGGDGPQARPLALAMLGAAVVEIAGLASGLLGPDTATIVGTPGTVAPLPALGAAAFFAAADPATIADGSAGIVLRRRGKSEIALGPGARRPYGESLLMLSTRPAAYIEAFDARGAHLTVTQPTNVAFLSPVLQFRSVQRIGADTVPFDTFATPARHLTLRALYFTPAQLASFRHAGVGATTPSLVVTAADERGNPRGIALASSGARTAIAGITLRATVGTYPALQVSSVAPAWALATGLLGFTAGIVLAGLRTRREFSAGSETAPA